LFIVRMERLSKLRITDRDGLLCLGLTIVALMVTLVIAASAHADELASGSGAPTADTQEPADSQPSGEPVSAEGQSPTPAEGGPEGQGATPEATPEGGAAATTSEEPAAPEGQVVGGSSEEPTVGEASPGPAPLETIETPTEAQSLSPSPPVEEASLPAAPEEVVVPAEMTKEATHDGTVETQEEPTSKTLAGEHAEGAGETGLSTPLRSSSLDGVAVAPLDGARTDSSAAEAPVASAGALPVIAMIAGTEVEGPPPGGGPPAVHGGMTSAQRAGGFSCELSQLGGKLTDNCAVGWLGAPRFVSVEPTGLVTAASSLVAATLAGSPSDGGHGGAAVSSPPVGPAPSPAPGGAAGAATGASGVAPLSTFLTLAGLLLLGAPRVLRRLRLSCEPWLAGCFVLVPERPD
jgi:hypothetical protein